MTNDAGLFVSEDFFDEDWNEEGNLFSREGAMYFPLYEGRMIDNFDHRLASTLIKDIKLQRSGESLTLSSEEKLNPALRLSASYWVSAADCERASKRLFQQGWAIGFMSITSATNARTCIASIVPQAGSGNSVIALLSTASAKLHVACLPTSAHFYSIMSVTEG